MLKNLDKLYKSVIELSYNKSLPINSPIIVRWYKKLTGNTIRIKHVKSGKKFRADKKLLKIVKEYNEKIILESLHFPGPTKIKYTGKVCISEVDSVNGKPRMVPDENGGFKEVIDDIFTKRPKYIYQFNAMYSKIRPELRAFISSGYYRFAKGRYLPKVYELHPKGNFYPFKT